MCQRRSVIYRLEIFSAKLRNACRCDVLNSTSMAKMVALSVVALPRRASSNVVDLRDAGGRLAAGARLIDGEARRPVEYCLARQLHVDDQDEPGQS